MTGWRPNTFTYPFGSYSRRSQELLEQLGFAASLGVEGKPCCLTRDPACLIRIPRYTRTSQKPPRSCSAISGIEQRARGCAALPLYRTFPSGTRVPTRISTP